MERLRTAAGPVRFHRGQPSRLRGGGAAPGDSAGTVCTAGRRACAARPARHRPAAHVSLRARHGLEPRFRHGSPRAPGPQRIDPRACAAARGGIHYETGPLPLRLFPPRIVLRHPAPDYDISAWIAARIALRAARRAFRFSFWSLWLCLGTAIRKARISSGVPTAMTFPLPIAVARFLRNSRTVVRGWGPMNFLLHFVLADVVRPRGCQWYERSVRGFPVFRVQPGYRRRVHACDGCSCGGSIESALDTSGTAG